MLLELFLCACFVLDCRTGTLASADELVSLMKYAKNVDELYRVANVEIGTLAELKNKTPQNKESIKKRAERHLLGELYADKVYLEDLLTKKMGLFDDLKVIYKIILSCMKYALCNLIILHLETLLLRFFFLSC